MTADELVRIASKLANQAFVRYWLHWNYPHEEVVVMAIQVRQWNGEGTALTPIRVDDLERRGFEWDSEDKQYYIDRSAA